MIEAILAHPDPTPERGFHRADLTARLQEASLELVELFAQPLDKLRAAGPDLAPLLLGAMAPLCGCALDDRFAFAARGNAAECARLVADLIALSGACAHAAPHELAGALAAWGAVAGFVASSIGPTATPAHHELHAWVLHAIGRMGVAPAAAAPPPPPPPPASGRLSVSAAARPTPHAAQPVRSPPALLASWSWPQLGEALSGLDQMLPVAGRAGPLQASVRAGDDAATGYARASAHARLHGGAVHLPEWSATSPPSRAGSYRFTPQLLDESGSKRSERGAGQPPAPGDPLGETSSSSSRSAQSSLESSGGSARGSAESSSGHSSSARELLARAVAFLTGAPPLPPPPGARPAAGAGHAAGDAPPAVDVTSAPAVVRHLLSHGRAAPTQPHFAVLSAARYRSSIPLIEAAAVVIADELALRLAPPHELPRPLASAEALLVGVDVVRGPPPPPSLRPRQPPLAGGDARDRPAHGGSAAAGPATASGSSRVGGAAAEAGLPPAALPADAPATAAVLARAAFLLASLCVPPSHAVWARLAGWAAVHTRALSAASRALAPTPTQAGQLVTLAHVLAVHVLPASASRSQYECRGAVARIVRLLVTEDGASLARLSVAELCVALAAGAAAAVANSSAAAPAAPHVAVYTLLFTPPSRRLEQQQQAQPQPVVSLQHVASLAGRIALRLEPASGISDGRVESLNPLAGLPLPFRERLRQLRPVVSTLGSHRALHARLFAAVEKALCRALRDGGAGALAGLSLHELTDLVGSLQRGFGGCYALTVDVCDALASTEAGGRECLGRAPPFELLAMCRAALKAGVVHGPLFEAAAELHDSQLRLWVGWLSDALAAAAASDPAASTRWPPSEQSTGPSKPSTWLPKQQFWWRRFTTRVDSPLPLAVSVLWQLVLSGLHARHTQLASRLLTFCDAVLLTAAEELVVEAGGDSSSSSSASAAAVSSAAPDATLLLAAAVRTLHVVVLGRLLTCHLACVNHNAFVAQRQQLQKQQHVDGDEDASRAAIFVGARAPCPPGASSLPVLSAATAAALLHEFKRRVESNAAEDKRAVGPGVDQENDGGALKLVTTFELGLAAAVRRFAAQHRLPAPSDAVACGDVFTADVGWPQQRLLVEADGPAHFLPLPSGTQVAVAAAATSAASSMMIGGRSLCGHTVHVSPLLTAPAMPKQQPQQHAMVSAPGCLAPARWTLPHAWAASRAVLLHDQLRTELLTRCSPPWTLARVSVHAWPSTQPAQQALVEALLLPHMDVLRASAAEAGDVGSLVPQQREAAAA